AGQRAQEPGYDSRDHSLWRLHGPAGAAEGARPGHCVVRSLSERHTARENGGCRNQVRTRTLLLIPLMTSDPIPKSVLSVESVVRFFSANSDFTKLLLSFS